MPPYRFRLDALRRLREVNRDELRGQLADAYQAAEKLRLESESVSGEIQHTVDHQRAVAGASTLDLNQVLESQRYEMFLKARLSDLDEKARLVEQEIARRQAAVVAADQQVQVLDKLDERGRQRHEAASRREEQKQIDEAAGLRIGARLNVAEAGGE